MKGIDKLKYQANDGKIFESEDKCLAYEQELIAKAEQAKKKEEERDKRWQEVVEARNKYISLNNKFCKDYPRCDMSCGDAYEDFCNFFGW